MSDWSRVVENVLTTLGFAAILFALALRNRWQNDVVTAMCAICGLEVRAPAARDVALVLLAHTRQDHPDDHTKEEQ